MADFIADLKKDTPVLAPQVIQAPTPPVAGPNPAEIAINATAQYIKAESLFNKATEGLSEAEKLAYARLVKGTSEYNQDGTLRRLEERFADAAKDWEVIHPNPAPVQPTEPVLPGRMEPTTQLSNTEETILRDTDPHPLADDESYFKFRQRQFEGKRNYKALPGTLAELGTK